MTYWALKSMQLMHKGGADPEDKNGPIRQRHLASSVSEGGGVSR